MERVTLRCSHCGEVKPQSCFPELPEVVCHSCSIRQRIQALRFYKMMVSERKGRRKIFRDDRKGYKIKNIL